MRTNGAIDKKKRKRRSDKGKRRKLYRNKKVKRKRIFNGIVKVYESNRLDGDPIKLYFWDIQRMDVNSWHHFSKKTRDHMHRYVYGKNRLRVDVMPEDFDTKDKVVKACEGLLWEGSWLILMWTHRNNRFHCSPRAVASVRIKTVNNEKKATVNLYYKNRSIKRYHFWKDK